MPGQLTPLLLTAMNGLLDNQSIDINAEFLAELDRYANQPLVKSYREIDGGNYYYPDAVQSFPVTSIKGAITSMYSSIPYIADLHTGENCGLATEYLTEYLLDWSYMLLATHRLQSHANPHAKFVQTLQIFLGFEGQMNNVINSAVNGSDIAVSSFTSMDELSTGNITAVSSDTPAFGNDLEKIQKYINFSELKYYGTPFSLLLALIRSNALALLADEFLAVAIDINSLADAIISSPVPALPEIQKIVYTVAEGVTGKKLTDILLIMDVSTEGLNTLADLIDTRKIFPESALTLNAMNGNALESIYSDNGISAYTNSLTSPQENIIPSNIAKANLAFRNSLFQIKNIASTQPKDLAEQSKAIETNTGLDAVNAFESALPDDVSTGLLTKLATGQGDEGLIYVTDGVGTPCGTTHIDTLIALNEYHEDIDNTLESGIVDKIDEINAESWIADADYRSLNPEPVFQEAGHETETEEEFNARWAVWNNARIAYVEGEVAPFLVELQALIDTLPSAPQEVSDGVSNSVTQVTTEKTNLSDAIDWPSDFGDYPGVCPSTPPAEYTCGVGDLCGALWYPLTAPASKKLILGFSESLHSLSEKTDLHNVVEVLEKLSISNQGGDAIVAALREGRNLNKLDKVGVKTDTKTENQPKTVLPRI